LKQSVTLQFPSLDSLYKFRAEINTTNFEVSIQKYLLTCDCTKEEIQLAASEYNAKVFTGKKNAQMDISTLESRRKASRN